MSLPSQVQQANQLTKKNQNQIFKQKNDLAELNDKLDKLELALNLQKSELNGLKLNTPLAAAGGSNGAAYNGGSGGVIPTVGTMAAGPTAASAAPTGQVNSPGGISVPAMINEPSGSLETSRNNSIKNLMQISRRKSTKPFDSKNIDGSLVDLNARLTQCESNEDILSTIDDKLQEQIDDMNKLVDRLVNKINQASGTTNVTNVANFTGVNGTTGGKVTPIKFEDGDPILDFDSLVEQVRLLKLNKVDHEKYELATFQIKERLDKLEDDYTHDDIATPTADAPKKSKKNKA